MELLHHEANPLETSLDVTIAVRNRPQDNHCGKASPQRSTTALVSTAAEVALQFAGRWLKTWRIFYTSEAKMAA
eukprot:4149060-Pleurochrysis_carterae.AAC.1